MELGLNINLNDSVCSINRVFWLKVQNLCRNALIARIQYLFFPDDDLPVNNPAGSCHRKKICSILEVRNGHSLCRLKSGKVHRSKFAACNYEIGLSFFLVLRILFVFQ